MSRVIAAVDYAKYEVGKAVERQRAEQIAERAQDPRHQKRLARWRRYGHSEKGLARYRRYQATPRGRERSAAYANTINGQMARMRSQLNQRRATHEAQAAIRDV